MCLVYIWDITVYPVIKNPPYLGKLSSLALNLTFDLTLWDTQNGIIEQQQFF